MCGINGIFAYSPAANPVDRDELIRTRDHMTRRGPDGEGQWLSQDGRIGLGHRRLSIIDLSAAGAQPMTSAGGRFVVTFNGEIYNYRTLRRDLEMKGRTFASQSDTEVLLHLYAERGAAMVRDLRGMFAFAIWDNEERSLFLARDPNGIKPLYYADDGGTFRFASQVKALLAGRAVPKDQEPAGLAGFYLFGSIPEPFTLYRQIRALPAGTALYVKQEGGANPQRYFSIAEVYCDAERRARERIEETADQAEDNIREALLDTIRNHLVADVPVGAFLSSGIDSGALAGLMRDAGQNSITTVTIAFSEFQGRQEDEAPLAAEIAKLYGTSHTTRVVTEAEFASDLPLILSAMDQPSIDGLNSWFVCKAARELGLKVAISGLGGDELFGGYPSFRDIPRWVRVFGIPSRLPYLGRGSRMLLSLAGRHFGGNPKAAGMIEFGGAYAGAYFLRRGLFMPWELGEMLDKEIWSEGLRRLAPLSLIEALLDPEPESSFARVSALESSFYMRNQLLRDTDWASMAHSLEVRVPLVDSVLLKKVAPINLAMGARGKIVNKMMLAQSPSRGLPGAVLSRPKTGFTTPIAKWLSNSDLCQPQIQERRQGSRAEVHWARQWASCVAAA